MNVLQRLARRDSWLPPVLAGLRRRHSTVKVERLEFARHGVPTEVVELQRTEIEVGLEPGQLLVKFLASPVNPADINTIQVPFLLAIYVQ